MGINSQPERLDLSDVDARRARDLGVKLVISTDALAHSPSSLDYIRYGVADSSGLVAKRRAEYL